MRLTLTIAILAACALALPARADDPASPACKLLTDAEATQVLGHKAQVSDGGAETMGTSGCSWVDTETYNAIGVNIMGGESLGGAAPDAAFDAQKQAMASAGKVEDAAGVGDKAYLVDSSSGGMNALSLYLLKGAKIASVTGSGITKDKMIEAGKLIAGHL